MKRILSLLLSLALTLTLAACGSAAGKSGTGSNPTPDGGTPASTTPETPLENQPEDGTPTGTDDGGKKILITYFSATNNTENIANHLNEILDADIYKITPETPYTSADLDYNTDCRANQEQDDASARPAISGSVDDIGQYDVIFLGYPIWWGQAPKIISTFLESYDFSGKTIVPFCTSGSSGIGSSAENLHSLAAGAAWMDGQRFSGGASSTDVQSWVDSLNFGNESEGTSS